MAGGVKAQHGLGLTLGAERVARGHRQQWKTVSREYRRLLFGVGEELRCRVRYFSDGTAIGTSQFLEELFLAKRDHFGANQKSDSRIMGHADWNGLCSMRDLRKNVVSPPGM